MGGGGWWVVGGRLWQRGNVTTTVTMTVLTYVRAFMHAGCSQPTSARSAGSSFTTSSCCGHGRATHGMASHCVCLCAKRKQDRASHTHKLKFTFVQAYVHGVNDLSLVTPAATRQSQSSRTGYGMLCDAGRGWRCMMEHGPML